MAIVTNANSTSLYSGKEELEVMVHAVNYNSHLIEQIIRHCPSNAQKILDFGAGNGYFAEKIQGLTQKKVICLEPDPFLKNEINSKSLDLIGDLKNIEDGSLDYVYSLNVFEHIEDDVSVLKDLVGKLKPNGKIFIYVPALQVLFTSNDVKVGHVRRYSMNGLIHLVKNAGLSPVVCIFQDHVGFFATLAYKMLDKNKNGSIGVGSVKFYDKFLFPVNFFFHPFLKKFLGKNLQIVASKEDLRGRE